MLSGRLKRYFAVDRLNGRARFGGPIVRLIVKHIVTVFVSALSIGAAGSAFAGEEDCGTLKNHFGPYDYRTVDAATLKLVEDFHFAPQVERTTGGQSGSVGADLSYVLSVFPNHHRALVSMVNWSIKNKTDKPSDSRFSMSCWFDRAIRQAPEDGQVRVIYGYYLTKSGDKKGALREYRQALDMGQNDANTHYNMGLALFDVKDYEGALDHAKKAYELGFQLPGLKKKLVQVGKWKD